MNILVAYDVCTETKEGQRRLRKVAQTCLNFGQRVQKSVFECVVSELQYECLKQRLLEIIDLAEDNLRLYRLPADKNQFLECFGLHRDIDFEGQLII
jgi:CRISPR-associated protein Cas2